MVYNTNIARIKVLAAALKPGEQLDPADAEMLANNYHVNLARIKVLQAALKPGEQLDPADADILAKSSAAQKASGQLSLLPPLSRPAGDHILTQWPPAAACAGMAKSNQARQMKADATGVPFANTGALLYLSPFLIVPLPTCVHRLPCYPPPILVPHRYLLSRKKSTPHRHTLSHAPVYAPPQTRPDTPWLALCPTRGPRRSIVP